jgi:hypothetical protein
MWEPRQVGQHAWSPAIPAKGGGYRRTLPVKFTSLEECQAYCDKRNA